MQAGLLDFEDGTQYERAAGGCTAATAHRGCGGDSSEEEEEEEGVGCRAAHSDEDDDLSD